MTFIVGLVLGVVGTVAYGMFVATPAPPAPVAVAVPAQAPMTITLDQRFLTALVQHAIADETRAVPGVAVPRTQVRAELRDGLIVVKANVEVLGAPTEGSVSVRPVLRGGKLAMDVVETNLGSITLPAMDRVLDTQINTRLQTLFDGMPVTVTGVGVDPSRGLVVTCQVDLDRLNQPQATR